MESGIIPECLKWDAIDPIYKSGDKSLPSNYRPRSLTPILMNILERVLRKQVMSMFTGSSCCVDMIYLDLSKAFDKVDHGVLLHKLRNMGMAGTLGTWFHSFFSIRYHCVRLPGGSITASPVISGVHQSTVMAPCYFEL